MFTLLGRFPKEDTTLHDPKPPQIESHLSYNELIGLALSFNARVDTLWQRTLYAHAAIVGVMVFFATADDPFLVPRLLVLFFYTLNLGITVAAFFESYSGLRAVTEDLKQFPEAKSTSNTQAWVFSQSYHMHAHRRLWLLGVVWLVLVYLLLFPMLGEISDLFA